MCEGLSCCGLDFVDGFVVEDAVYFAALSECVHCLGFGSVDACGDECVSCVGVECEGDLSSFEVYSYLSAVGLVHVNCHV